MKVIKFGGTSIQDASSIKNVLNVLQQIDTESTIMVVSAMGKMTNAFEEIVNAYFYDKSVLNQKVDLAQNFHTNLLNDLFENRASLIFKEVFLIFMELKTFLNKNDSTDYNLVYDNIVSTAEQISSRIISEYLNINNQSNIWLDVCEYIRTDSNYRGAKVDWATTELRIKTLDDTPTLLITQGFLGSNEQGNTTTLGREGSDFTAAIFGYCLDAESVTIFKDVEGVLTGDPKLFEDTELLSQISYREALEMAFYGATVIHPKTLKPLKEKEIPLYVKSFMHPTKDGTSITKGVDLKPVAPCFILKKNQLLVSISTKDFSFIMEDNISEIFELLHSNKLKMSLVQNTAISFTVCLEDKYGNFNTFLDALQLKYKVKYDENLSLLTIRHFDKNSIEKIETAYEVLLKQTGLETVQFVVKE